MLDVACSIGAATDELTPRLGASCCPKTAGTKLCTDDKASIIKPQAIILDANAILLVAMWKAARTRAALERLENALGCVTISPLSFTLFLSLSLQLLLFCQDCQLNTHRHTALGVANTQTQPWSTPKSWPFQFKYLQRKIEGSNHNSHPKCLRSPKPFPFEVSIPSTKKVTITQRAPPGLLTSQDFGPLQHQTEAIVKGKNTSEQTERSSFKKSGKQEFWISGLFVAHKDVISNVMMKRTRILYIFRDLESRDICMCVHTWYPWWCFVFFRCGLFWDFFLPRVFIVFFTWIFRGIATTHRRRDPLIFCDTFSTANFPMILRILFRKYQAGILHHTQLEVTSHMSLVRWCCSPRHISWIPSPLFQWKDVPCWTIGTSPNHNNYVHLLLKHHIQTFKHKQLSITFATQNHQSVVSIVFWIFMAGLQLQVPHTHRQTNLQGPDGFESDKHSMELRVIWVNGDVSPTQILKHIYIYLYRYLSYQKI